MSEVIGKCSQLAVAKEWFEWTQGKDGAEIVDGQAGTVVARGKSLDNAKSDQRSWLTVLSASGYM